MYVQAKAETEVQIGSQPHITLQDLHPPLREWLAKKGFTGDEDLQDLKNMLNGLSIWHGLFIMLGVRKFQRDVFHSGCPRVQKPSKSNDTSKKSNFGKREISRETIEAVKDLAQIKWAAKLSGDSPPDCGESMVELQQTPIIVTLNHPSEISAEPVKSLFEVSVTDTMEGVPDLSKPKLVSLARGPHRKLGSFPRPNYKHPRSVYKPRPNYKPHDQTTAAALMHGRFINSLATRLGQGDRWKVAPCFPSATNSKGIYIAKNVHISLRHNSNFVAGQGVRMQAEMVAPGQIHPNSCAKNSDQMRRVAFRVESLNDGGRDLCWGQISKGGEEYMEEKLLSALEAAILDAGGYNAGGNGSKWQFVSDGDH